MTNKHYWTWYVRSAGDRQDGEGAIGDVNHARHIGEMIYLRDYRPSSEVDLSVMIARDGEPFEVFDGTFWKCMTKGNITHDTRPMYVVAAPPTEAELAFVGQHIITSGDRRETRTSGDRDARHARQVAEIEWRIERERRDRNHEHRPFLVSVINLRGAPRWLYDGTNWIEHSPDGKPLDEGVE